MTEETHCPSCGLAYAMVGRAHNCRPRLVPTPKLMAAPAKTKQSITQKPDMQAFAGFPPEPCSNCAQLEAEVERLNARIKSLEVDIKLQIIDNKTIVVNPVDNNVDNNSKRGRGRPKIEGRRPWDELGITRQAWYKRQKK